LRSFNRNHKIVSSNGENKHDENVDDQLKFQEYYLDSHRIWSE